MGIKIVTEILFVFVKKERMTRGHGVTLAKNCRLNIIKFSISQRTVNEWEQIIS